MISERCKLPLKVAIALTLAITSALWLGWEKPYWAAFAVIVMAATETTGHSLRKGRHRILGTLLGVVAAFLFVGCFAQQPLPFLLFFTLFAATCVYLQANPRSGYIWSMSLMVCTLILVMGKLSGELTFSIAVLRLQETLLGVICFTLVFSLLWPVSSRRLLHATLQDFFADQQEKISKTADALAGNGERTQGLGFGDGIRFMSRVEDLVPAATADSYHIAGEAKGWEQFLAQLRQWALLCGHLSEAEELLGMAAPQQAQKDTQRLLARIKQRLAVAEALLGGADSGDFPLPQALTLSCPAGDDPGHHGALVLLEQVLNQMDQLSAEMLQTLQAVLLAKNTSRLQPESQTTQSHTKHGATSLPKYRGLDPERIYQAVKACMVIWICIALWLYVPMTGGPMIVMLGVVFGSVVVSLPFPNVKALFREMLCWSVVILLQFVLIMPGFTELWQLALFYFLNSFGIWYCFAKPQQVLTRLLGSQVLVLMTAGAMQLQPVYDIRLALLQLLLIGVVMLVIFWVDRTFFSCQPEKVFLRQMKQLRYLFARQIKEIGRVKMGNRGFVDRARETAFGLRTAGQSPLLPVATAEQAMGRINWAAYPAVDQARLRLIISRLYAVNLRLLSLRDCCEAGWWKQQTNPQLDLWITRALIRLSALLEQRDENVSLYPLEDQLNQLQLQLQEYRTAINTDSVLQFALPAGQALELFRVLTAVKLLLEELKQLHRLVSDAGFNELKVSYFAI